MIIQRGSLPYYLCTFLFLGTASGCGMDRANDHLESMDKNTQRLNENIESYHQDISKGAQSLENLSQSIQSLQSMAQSMTSSLMGLIRPSSELPADRVVETPEIPGEPPSTTPSTEHEAAQPSATATECTRYQEEVTRYREQIARITREMATMNETISNLRRQLAPRTNSDGSNGVHPANTQPPTDGSGS